MNSYKTLFDLSASLHSPWDHSRYESSILYKTLSECSNLKLDGLLYAAETSRFSAPKHFSKRAESIEQAHYFIHSALGHELTFLAKVLSKLKIKRYFTFTKKQYDLFTIDSHYNEVIWRNIFSRYLSVNKLEQVKAGLFYYTDMTLQTLSSLNTNDYDFVIFPEVSAVRVSGNTMKIVRFHDPIALTEPDFISRQQASQFINQMKQASQDSYFVCDSESSRNKLVSLYPLLEQKSCVIPNALVIENDRMDDISKLNQIVSTRLSHAILSQKQLHDLRGKLSHDKPFDYILWVGPLGAEKNILSLMHAWKKINYHHHDKLKLVMISQGNEVSPGLHYSLRAHAEQGGVMLLSGVTNVEKSYLYSHAALFVSTAYAETSHQELCFAMHHACPTLVSDIPLHRSLMDNATVYCDPYSESSIASALEQLLYSNNASALRKELIAKGLKKVESISPEKISAQWMDLLTSLKEVANVK